MGGNLMSAFVEFSAPIDDSVEALSFSFGVPGGGSQYGPGSYTTKAQLRDASFVKSNDSLSSDLLGHSVRGTIFKIVTVEYYRSGVSRPYLTITLVNVMISSYSFARDTELVGLNFESASQKYFVK